MFIFRFSFVYRRCTSFFFCFQILMDWTLDLRLSWVQRLFRRKKRLRQTHEPTDKHIIKKINGYNSVWPPLSRVKEWFKILCFFFSKNCEVDTKRKKKVRYMSNLKWLKWRNKFNLWCKFSSITNFAEAMHILKKK